MGNQSGKKTITAEEMSRLLLSHEHRAACITYALANREKGYSHPDVTPRVDGLLQSIAGTVKHLLEARLTDGIAEAMYPDGQMNQAWVSVRDYLDTFDPNWPVPNDKNPAQGVIAAKMVRCAILKAAAPIVEKQKAERDEADRKRLEAERQREAAQRTWEEEQAKKRADAKRKADDAKRAKEAKRRGTCGIEFAGASMRFTADDETVFMYRQDVRRVFFYTETKQLVIVDAHGTEFMPTLTGDAGDACAEVCDWRWRASESWEDGQ